MLLLFFVRYDDTLLLKREAALQAIEPAASLNNESYQQIKDQVFLENQQLQIGSSATFSDPALNFLQDESHGVIASSPVLAGSRRVSFAKENEFPRQQSLPSSRFNSRDAHVGVGLSGYIGNRGVSSSSGGGGTPSQCSRSCPLHCYMSQPCIQEPLRPVRNPYGPQPRVDKPRVYKRIPPQFVKTPSQMLRGVEFLPTGENRYCYGRPSVDFSSSSIDNFYDPEVDRIIENYDLELFERGEVVSKVEQESRLQEEQERQKREVQEGREQEQRREVQKQEELKKNKKVQFEGSDLNAIVQASFSQGSERQQGYSTPFSNVTQFFQFNSGMELNYEQVFKNLVNRT